MEGVRTKTWTIKEVVHVCLRRSDASSCAFHNLAPRTAATSVIHKLLGKPVSQRRVICPQFVHDVRFKKKKPPVGGCTEY